MPHEIINVDFGNRSYPIKIARGLVTEKALLEGLIITDDNVLAKYPHLCNNRLRVVIPHGEDSKQLYMYEDIVGKIPADTQRIIAVGGGVVGDLAGFIAGTFKRGIELIQVPTSLMAMVDSSIGGKNGVNLEGRKNYLGTIYQPREVLTDPLFLNTLPREELANGLAEIIKYAAVFNFPTLPQVEKEIRMGESLERLIHACATTKARVVEADEQDRGYRHTLNFGHTIGHAIEILYRLGHGEAVALGMVYESELAVRSGKIDQLRKEKIIAALQANNLPTRLNIEDNLPRIMEIMRADKKGKFIFAFTKDFYQVPIEEKMILEVLTKR